MVSERPKDFYKADLFTDSKGGAGDQVAVLPGIIGSVHRDRGRPMKIIGPDSCGMAWQTRDHFLTMAMEEK